MTGKYPFLTLCALAALVCLTTPLLGADQGSLATPSPPPDTAQVPPLPPVDPATPAGSATPAVSQSQPQSRVLFPGPVPGDVDQSPYLNPLLSSPVSDPMVRLGWWANKVSGSPYRVGEYENWTSGPFVNIDGLWSDGCRTLDLSATMTDDSDGSVRAYYYGPDVEAKVDYDAFPHNLGHDPLSNMATYKPGGAPIPSTLADTIFKEDYNPGVDYAIQVQEFKANLKGQVTENIRWRLDLFEMEKVGVRQENSIAPCYTIPGHASVPPNTTKVCHDCSNAQSIDWKTTEITPRLEGNWGALTIEYSHPLKIFNADDSTVTRDYYGGSASALPLAAAGTPAGTYQYDYAVVDDNITNIDQVKISLNFDDDNKFYALMLNGDTYNNSIGTNRYFNNVDVRWTNTSIENLTLCTFWKQFNECETLVSPANAPYGDYILPSGAYNTYGNPTTNQDTDRHSEDVGASALWRPFGRGFGLGGLAIHAEYDYGILHRNDAVYGNPLAPTTSLPENSVIDETYTITNSFEIRPTVRWSPCFDTYLKYRCTLCDEPLIGVKLLDNGNSNGTYNTLLPQQDNLVEIGGTWLPTKELVCNATVGIEQAHTNIPDPASVGNGTPINFTENSFPYNISLAYTPMCGKWTFSGGYADYTDFISQLITLGDDYVTGPSFVSPSTATPANVNPLTTRWGYMGDAEVFDLGVTYRWSKDVKLTAAAQYTHGVDTILPLGTYVTPSVGGTKGPMTYNLSNLPGASQVIVDTVRVQAGVDWQVREHLSTFFRYQYYNFDDPTQPYNSGIVNGFLVGLNWIH